MFKRLWVQIPVPYTGWIFSHIDLLQKLYYLFENTENKMKKRPVLAHFLKRRLSSFRDFEQGKALSDRTFETLLSI